MFPLNICHRNLFSVSLNTITRTCATQNLTLFKLTFILPSCAPVASISVSLLKHMHSTASSIIMKLSCAWYFRSCITHVRSVLGKQIQAARTKSLCENLKHERSVCGYLSDLACCKIPHLDEAVDRTSDQILTIRREAGALHMGLLSKLQQHIQHNPSNYSYDFLSPTY